MTRWIQSDWREFKNIETILDMDDESAHRYEEACLEAMRQYIPARITQMRAVGREPLDVLLRHQRPSTQIAVTYRDAGGRVRAAAFPLWSEEGRIRSSNANHLVHPNDLADIVTINLAEPGPEPGDISPNVDR